MSYDEYQQRQEDVGREYADYFDAVQQMNSMRDRDTPGSGRYPHCDAWVLHGPQQQCRFCNERADLQLARQHYRVLYTGEEAREGWRTCPAEKVRPVQRINNWHGNVAYIPEVEEADKIYWQQFRKAVFGDNG